MEALDGCFSFYVSIKGSKKQIHGENIIDLFEHLLMDFVSFTQEDEHLFRFRQNHVEVEVISFLVFYFLFFMFWFYTLSLDIQILLLYFKMHFLVFKCCGLYNDFNFTFSIYVECEYCHFSTEKKKIEFKVKLYIEVK